MKYHTKFKQTEIGMIPEEWKFDVLSKHLYIKGRIGWKGLQKSEYLKDSTGIAILNGTQIQDSKLDWTDCGRVPEWRYDESPEIQLKENDIVMTKDGTIGKIAFIDKLPEKSSVASGIFVIRSESGDIDQRFLFYYFKSPLFKRLIETRKEGSVIPHLYQRDFEEFPFAYPLIKEQQSIAKTLSDLDSKIEINQQMNKTLEILAKAIFKHWFVDFEFLNEGGKPYKSSGGEMRDSELGSIPKKWNVKSIYDCAQYVNGEAFRDTDFSLLRSGLPIIKIFELKYGITPQTNFTDKNVKSKYFIDDGDILFAWSGSPDTSIDTFIWTGGKGIVNQHIFKVSALHSNEKAFVFFLLKYLNKIFIEIARDKQTTGLGHVTINDMKKLFVIVPDNNIMEQFNKVANPIFHHICHNNINSQTLRQIRDSLIPKLMSGKVRVPVEVN